MKFFTKHDPKKVEDLKQRASDGDAIARMMKTEGWQILEAHFRDQLAALTADNSVNALNWEDYLKKSAKISAMNLLLIDVYEFVSQGQEAEEELKKFTV